MSVPETNDLSPAPVRISTRTSGSLSSASHVSCRCSYISNVIALRASGRLNVMVATLPSRATSSWSAVGSAIYVSRYSRRGFSEKIFRFAVSLTSARSPISFSDFG